MKHSFLIRLSLRSNEKKGLNRIDITIYQEIANIVRGNISRVDKFNSQLSSAAFHVFRNLRDIDFKLDCKNVPRDISFKCSNLYDFFPVFKSKNCFLIKETDTFGHIIV